MSSLRQQWQSNREPLDNGQGNIYDDNNDENNSGSSHIRKASLVKLVMIEKKLL